MSLVPDGIIATGWKSGISQPLSEPATHTVPPRRTRRSESTAVSVPTRSSTWSGPSGQISRRLPASGRPSSTRTWSAPAAASAPARPRRRVVAAVSTPYADAIDTAARPTDDVPPRTSNRPPAPGAIPAASSEPRAVRYVSGSAARTSHGNVVVTGISSGFGTSAYSA